ncbi:acyl--CoA ligase [Aspergillus clavatus NRRL 1]|uniref:Coenzyme A synthetase, putative n=1 Tax=Aspergillus clavatus (strain ATCC 1007 / CBS 513.65 / DSM 816 / NCTC 3887 / NRRL 1 / QM 1276 / 107) TaxID=344612 RepID=A1CGZ3_ASPCL|nr:coenzyme A synthetase, putative [Aspergillus clavatus NRRL 1]EAW10148.1 coenzyme A synthetase, putative [Aspergillus clavatus NRRL 1]
MPTLARSFSSVSSNVAVIVPNKPSAFSVSYQQLHTHVADFQAKLARLGVGHGAAVSLALANSYEFIVSFLAASWQRSIAAPLNPAYKQHEFEFYIDDLSSTLVLIPRGTYAQNGPAVRAGRKYNAAIAECYWDGKEVVLDVKEQGKLSGKGDVGMLQAQPDDIALVLHTSGTTGRPKAVPLTHKNLTTSMNNIRATYKLTPEDRTYLVMPLFHVHGLLAGFLAPLLSGGSVIVPPRFSASEFWADFVGFHANWYTAVPTIHQILLKTPLPNPIPKIRFIRSCSSPLSPKTFEDLEKTFKAPVLEAYAMTEASHQMTSNPLPSGKRQPGSVGIGQGVEVKILDQEGNEVAQGAEAEICVRGENVTKGYLNNPAANKSSFTKEGFFRTGDQGKKDPDGYVIITGRIKELINKGGEKISPIELDNTLLSHPGVAEAVCFSIPDEGHYGEDIGAAVVLKSAGAATEADLKSWVAGKLAKFKTPKQVWIVSQIPKTATGKIQRRKVAEAMLKPKAKL